MIIISGNEIKEIQQNKDSLLTNGSVTSKHSSTKKLNVDTDLTIFTKFNSKWIRNLTLIIKVLDNNMAENLVKIAFDNDISDP